MPGPLSYPANAGKQAIRRASADGEPGPMRTGKSACKHGRPTWRGHVYKPASPTGRASKGS